MNLPKLATPKECTGCLACVDSCSHNAISFQIEKDGHVYVSVNNELCIGCKICEKTCPIVSGYSYAKSETANFFAAWNTDLSLRKRSASGGAFSAIASYVLDRKGIVFGASIVDGYDIKHIFIDNKKDLHLLQGSKYAYSLTTSSYKQVYSFLREDRLVLFSGTACQVAGLLSFLKNKKYNGKLITIDLICGGVPSRLLIEKFIENEPYKINKIQSFRTKEKGWKSHGFKYNLKTIDDKGTIHDYTNIRNLITDGFCLELTNRYSCYNCKFVGTNRQSDYTIGDLWGDKKYPNEHYNGLSVVVAHSESSTQLLKEELTDYIKVYSVSSADVIANNPRLVSGKNYLRFSLMRKFMPLLFQKMNYKTLKKIYAYDFSNYSIWIVYKILRRFARFISKI